MVKKLCSRKLWMALLGVATGVAIIFGVDEEEVSIIGGAVTALLSVVCYIVTEGRVDAKGVESAVAGAEKIAAAVKKATEEAEAEQ